MSDSCLFCWVLALNLRRAKVESYSWQDHANLHETFTVVHRVFLVCFRGPCLLRILRTGCLFECVLGGGSRITITNLGFGGAGDNRVDPGPPLIASFVAKSYSLQFYGRGQITGWAATHFTEEGKSGNMSLTFACVWQPHLTGPYFPGLCLATRTHLEQNLAQRQVCFMV